MINMVRQPSCVILKFRLRLHKPCPTREENRGKIPVPTIISNLRKHERRRLHISCRVSRFVGVKPQPTVIFSFRKNERLRLYAPCPTRKKCWGENPAICVISDYSPKRRVSNFQKRAPLHDLSGSA